LSHQRGKKQKTHKKTTTKYPKFKCNTVSVSLSTCRYKKKKEKQKVWRQFCECLSVAVFHLLTTVSQLLLEALLSSDLRDELNTHLAPQALFI
jgi:ABC-type uncharacterized transport system fused permease/ATPase subunit